MESQRKTELSLIEQLLSTRQFLCVSSFRLLNNPETGPTVPTLQKTQLRTRGYTHVLGSMQLSNNPSQPVPSCCSSQDMSLF